MPASIGVNLRVTGHCKQGGRKYMEDYFSVAYQQTEDEKDLEYAFFGIFDGHGGSEAAIFAKEHLMEFIVRQRQFWSDKDEDVLKAIREGFITTHMAMLKEQEKWPRTASGLPSTAGTTASIAFIRRGRIFTGHVGDSGIILGYQNPDSPTWEARRLTKDHKPESRAELQRIEQCGGKVVSKSGVPRVVWYRPQIGHKGPITRRTPFDEIPFLAVARSLGDLWSYNSANNEFVVSPEPDTNVIPIDTNTFRCLIFGTDGLWNMISASTAVSIVQAAEQHNAMIVLSENPREKTWINPSMNLVERALDRWSSTRMRADNTSVVTLMLDPPGPPRSQVIRNAQKLLTEQHQIVESEPSLSTTSSIPDCLEPVMSSQQYPQNSSQEINTENQYPATGLKILTRYENFQPPTESSVKPCLTEEYLDKLHQEFYASIQTDMNEYWEENSVDSTEERLKPKPSCSKTEDVVETIQINVVSSSSDLQKKGKGKKIVGKCRKNTNELDSSSSTNKVTVSKVVSDTKQKKLKVQNDISEIKEQYKYVERRCRSLGPGEIDGVKTRNQTSECDRQTRLINTRVTRSETLEKCYSDFKRSRSLGPCDIKNDKTRYQTENKSRNYNLKNKNSENNQNFQQRNKSSCSANNQDQTSINQNLEKSVDCDEENRITYSSILKRSKSLGPRDLSNVKSVQTPKSKSKSNSSRENIHDVSFEKSTTRSQSLSTKNVLRNELFSTPPRTRSQGLAENSSTGKKTRSNILKQGDTNFSNMDQRSRSVGPESYTNISISPHQGVRTRSCQTPERLSNRLRQHQNTPRPSKRDRTDSDEENIILNPPKIKRSRSLGPLDLAITTNGQIVKKSRGRPPKREKNESDEENTILSTPKDTNFSNLERRSKSVGQESFTNISILSHQGVRTRSCQTPERLSNRLRQNQNTPRPSKRDRTDSDEENIILIPPKIKRSRSLGPLDLAITTNGQIVKKSRGRPPKRERNENDEENTPKFKRSRSLGPLDISVNENGQIVKKLRGRPPKRERHEIVEENIVLNARNFKRSRSLGPRDLRSKDTFVERNLKEKNHLDKGFYSDVMIMTRSQKNRRLPN